MPKTLMFFSRASGPAGVPNFWRRARAAASKSPEPPTGAMLSVILGHKGDGCTGFTIVRRFKNKVLTLTGVYGWGAHVHIPCAAKAIWATHVPPASARTRLIDNQLRGSKGQATGVAYWPAELVMRTDKVTAKLTGSKLGGRTGGEHGLVRCRLPWVLVDHHRSVGDGRSFFARVAGS